MDLFGLESLDCRIPSRLCYLDKRKDSWLEPVVLSITLFNLRGDLLRCI
jgi:hypothetical protein